MKSLVKKILHGILGFQRYLNVFARYKIRTLKKDRKEKDFFAFLAMIKDPGIVLDIGANIGVMTYYLSTEFPTSQVWAFEPIPHNINTLKTVISKFRLNNVTVHECALGNETGTLKMIMPVVNSVKMHGLSHVKHESISDFNEGKEFEVTATTLDVILKDRTNKVSAIKMDVENFEYFVLEGGEILLAQDKPIIYTELWDNENRYRCMDFLQNLGYSTHVVVDEKMQPYNKDVHQTQNFIFIPEN